MCRLERMVSLDPNSASFCVQFRPKTNGDEYFISIKNGSQYSSYVGCVCRGGQSVTLQMKSYCVDREATIMHEFMHDKKKIDSFSFWHEQSRPDRDYYVTINFDNVQKGSEHTFNKYLSDVTDTLDLPYDYNSKNGLATIMTEDPNVRIGQRYTLSTNDIAEIQRYYQRS
ncbi:unnamed protein product [Adineta steineri]|uniref:Metalloendopeptidase n=1 Tax=Adineta steineri TaxID=433720 RepID=A0A814ZZW8_9BILA|nr:unnamed protein product [Adineta steineri]